MKDPQVHTFSTTGVAYDASQVLDHIRNGDVLSVPDEMVVGILIEAWPCAVTDQHGQFHTLGPDISWEAVPSMDEVDSPLDYTASLAVARKEINRLQYEARKGK